MDKMINQSCLILLAHGSRDPRWQAPFEALCQQLADQHNHAVTLAYMEMCEPTLDQKIEEAIEGGVMEIQVLPLFMAQGGHLRHDVPDQIVASQQQHPHLQIKLLPPIGENPLVQQAIANIVAEAFTSQ